MMIVWTQTNSNGDGDAYKAWVSGLGMGSFENENREFVRFVIDEGNGAKLDQAIRMENPTGDQAIRDFLNTYSVSRGGSNIY